MKRALLIILLQLQGLAACSGGGGGGCVDSTDCDDGWGCSLERCIPLDSGQDVEPGDWEVTDLRDVEAAETPREEALEQPPEAIDPPSEAEAPPDDAPAEEGPSVVGIVGDPCTAIEDCVGVPGADKECLTTTGMFTFNGGYCSATCTSDADCDETIARCVTVMIVSYCLRTCTNTDECRAEEGYACKTLPITPAVDTYCLPDTGG